MMQVMMYGPSHLDSSLPTVAVFATRLRTMSPGARGRILTFRLYVLATPSLYLDMVDTACTRCSSRRSREVSRSIGSASAVAQRDLAVNSPGVMASSPKRSLNGEKLVALVGDVRSAHRALWSSSGQSPFGRPTRRFFKPSSWLPLARSTAPFDLGCPTDAKHIIMPKFWQNARNTAESNWVPLSVTMSRSTPYRQIMLFHAKRCATAAMILATGSASTHLEKYSMVMNAKRRLPLAVR